VNVRIEGKAKRLDKAQSMSGWGIWCIETVGYDEDRELPVRTILKVLRARWDAPFVQRNAVPTRMQA